MNDEVHLPFSELMMIAGTRAALGVGIGLLASAWLTPGQRQLVGWSLIGLGVATTIPLASDVFARKSRGGIGQQTTLASLAQR